MWTERPVLAPPFKAGDLGHIPDLSGLWCLICALLRVVRDPWVKDWTWGQAGVSCCECDKLALVVVAHGAQTGGGEAEPVE